MLHVVQHTAFKICQCCLSIIGPSGKTFRMPWKGKEGKFEWKGCFCCPNCAVAALKWKSDAAKLVVEKHAELLEAFQATLRRNDKGEPSYIDNPQLTITAAPNPKTLLKCFELGGNLTSEEFRKTFDPSGLYQKVFDQVIPLEEEAQPSSEEETEPSASRSNVTGWKLVKVDRKCKNQKGLDAASAEGVKGGAPRNMAAVIAWLARTFSNLYCEKSDSGAFVVYPHSKTDKIFAIGSPEALMPENLQLNSSASKVIGLNVYGDPVWFVARNMLKIRKMKKRTASKKAVREEPESPQSCCSCHSSNSSSSSDESFAPPEKRKPKKKIQRKENPIAPKHRKLTMKEITPPAEPVPAETAPKGPQPPEKIIKQAAF